MDTWDSGGNYESFMGSWSRRMARVFLQWLGVPANARWLDVGCGTGALTGTIADLAAPASLTGIDLSPVFVDAARANVGERADLHVGDAQSLPFPDDAFDAVVSGIALNFVPDPDAAVQQMRRVARPSGTVATYLWDYADGMQMIRAFWDAAIALDPAARSLDEGERFPLCRPEALEAVFSAAGLRNIVVRPLEVPTTFPSFDAYWQPFLGGQGPAPGYAVALAPFERERLADRLRSDLPIADDGSIALTARAWAIQGLAPP